ncbi:MAG: hypothetical protein HDR23_09800 [Lachnospiraceae bacterium]|nr:hypothetical protein [Lachnospiraceae bacterium]
MDKPKIVIHCASGLGNIGDEALLISFIKRYQKTCDITVLCMNGPATRKYTGYHKCFSDTDKECKKLISECDIFILGGGTLFQDETSIYNIYRWGHYLNYAHKLNKKTMVYANGIGPLNYAWSRKYVSEILCKTNVITLRDAESLSELQSMGINHATVTADGVFGLPFHEHTSQNFHYEEPYVCICLRHWFDLIPFLPVSVCKRLNMQPLKNRLKYGEFIDTMVLIINLINEHYHYNIILLPFMIDRDYKVASDIVAKVKCKKHIHIFEEKDFDVQKFFSVIKGAQFVIGMRLHSIIFSIMCATPFIALSYSQKVLSLLNYTGFQNLVVDVNNMHCDEVMELINFIETNRSEISSQEMNVYEEMKAREDINDKFFTSLLNNKIT